MSEHSECNIRTSGLYSGFSDVNKTVIARNYTKFQPRSINRVAVGAAGVPNVSGQVEFQFNTSNQQWLDLFNSYILTRYILATPADNIMHLTQNMISQAYLYVNGVQVAFTNNWTVASRVNKRIQFAKQYNQSVHGMTYRSDATLVASAALEAVYTAGGDGAAPDPVLQVPPAGIFTDKEYLDGFFIRDRDSCWIPPNSEVRVVLVIDPTYPSKAARQPNNAGLQTTIDVTGIEFVVPSVIKRDPTPSEYTLKFITNQITTSTVTADCNRSLTVDPNIVKVAIAFQDDRFATAAANKTRGGEVLSYPTQNEKTDGERVITGTAGAAQLNTLQLQLGSIVNPPQAFDFATNLHREAYEQYMHLTGKTLQYESQETFMDWLTEPIYLFDFPRPIEDKATNLIVRGTRTTSANVAMHIMEFDLQLVNFMYDPKSGVAIATTTLK
jgi:hypothetical protein